MNKQAMAILVATGILFNGNAAPTMGETINNDVLTKITDEFHPYKSPRIVALEKEFERVKQENDKKLREEQERLIQQKLEEEKVKEQIRIKSVSFNSYDITQPSNIDYDEMKEVLSESHYANFAELSDAFVAGEKEYGVNAFALVAIAGLESGWNTSERANNGRNNIVGMAVYDDESYGSIYASKYHCIMDLAKQLKTYYLTPGAEHYNGTSTSLVNKKYSTTPTWYKEVDSIGDELVAIYNERFRNGEAY